MITCIYIYSNFSNNSFLLPDPVCEWNVNMSCEKKSIVCHCFGNDALK